MTNKTTTIEPPKKWQMINFSELWEYRELLIALSLRDIKVRYKQTVLGAAWAILQPLTTMIVFTVIFGKLAKIPSDGYPYPVFVYAGLLAWTFFATAVSTSGASLVGSSQLVSKIYFPRLIVPIASIGTSIMDFLVSSSILLLLMLYYQIPWTLNLLAAPFMILGVLMTALGVGTLLSALTVSYRDFRYVIPFMVQIWMYVTPVVYPITFVPEQWRWVLLLNPMTGYIEGIRSAFLGTPFDLVAIGSAVLFSLVLFILGLTYFRSKEKRFADVI